MSVVPPSTTGSASIRVVRDDLARVGTRRVTRRGDRIGLVATIGMELERQGDRATLRLVGDLDYRCSDEVLAMVDRQLHDPSISMLDLDLSGLGYCDSTGLGALIAIHTRTADRGMPLTLLDPPQVLRRLLTLTGLDAYFVIRGEPDGAAVR